jgi:hypothetical protein
VTAVFLVQLAGIALFAAARGLLIGSRASHRCRVERRAALSRVCAAYGEPAAALGGRLQRLHGSWFGPVRHTQFDDEPTHGYAGALAGEVESL